MGVQGTEVRRLALDLGRMIESARGQVARAANAALTTLYWELGNHIHARGLAGRRAEYGAQIVAAVGRQLEARHGRGFGEKNLRRMIPVRRGVSGSGDCRHTAATVGMGTFQAPDPHQGTLSRDFYAEMCRIHGWSTRELAQKIDGMLYERTVLSKQPEQLIRRELAALREHGELTPVMVFQDPYMLDFSS